MSPPKSNESPNPGTGPPRRPSAAKNGATTPTNRRASVQAGATPKSAPATAGQGSRKKPLEPNLLADFLLGRPSPARALGQRSASKQRRKSVALDAAGVREELRQEMRAAAVRRLQQPGGVRDRVKQWQKTSTTAMKVEGGGVPHAEDVRSEPTDVAVQIDAESVTEEDRVRIKFRQKQKRRKPPAEKTESTETPDEGETGHSQQEKSSKDESEGPSKAGQPKVRPKKRIVSDDNWMKRRKGKSPPQTIPPKPKIVEAKPTPIPKDFLQRTAQNPSVQHKIKDWAKRVEVPEVPEAPEDMSSDESPRKTTPKSPRVKQYHHATTGETVTVEEEASSVAPAKPEIKVKPTPAFDDGIRVRPLKPKKSKADVDDGIRILPTRKKEPPDDGIRVRPIESTPPDDGIRVRPLESTLPDDGIRVRPLESTLPDDGIRVRPLESTLPDDGIRIRPGRRTSVDEITVRPASSRRTSTERSMRVPSTRRDRSPSDVVEVIQVIEEFESEVATPTRRQGSSHRKSRKGRSPKTAARKVVAPSEDQQSESETVDAIPRDHPSDDSSERPPTLAGNKSLADIPVGFSAFSVLDLPLGADARNSAKRPAKAQRNPSFKAVPNVFKKVMSGAKEIIQEKVDAPRPGVNQPPSIESWLNGTVDPFVEGSPKAQPAGRETQERSQERAQQVSLENPPEKPQEPLKRSVSQARQKEAQKEAAQREAQREAQKEARRKEAAQPPLAPLKPETHENDDPKLEESDATPKKLKTPAGLSPGLKRRRATRSGLSPIKTGGKKPFRETLKEAFRGESAGIKLPPTVYPSYETDYDAVSDPEDDYYDEDDDWESREPRRRSTGSGKRSPSPGPSSMVESSHSSTGSDSYLSRRRPPTKGHHELSTIVSEETSSVTESDTVSDISHTTVTQATAFTKSTDRSTNISRRKSSRKSSLKRRPTKHSDLVSVLSLPDTGHLVPPSRSKSVKSSRSLHRKPSKADKSKSDELLEEFSDDEYFYGRELKTLVDGVVPVLLKDVVRGGGDRKRETGNKKEDAMAKAVVDMGVALERLRNFHKQVPLANMRRLLTWLEDVSYVYDEYLDVWRLGFQGLIVNLAPASGHFDDADSLLNALPRNEDGDVLGEHGERVDVAYLLKRPLIRIKWMTKFLKAAVLVMEDRETDDLLLRYEALQEKARKRHREEVARMTDEDANSTDTTRARDLRNFAPLDGVIIAQDRQVAAKDSWAFDLDHSTGQRLECQVELIHRDNPDVPSDKGDILVREIGNSARSWLLFPPIPKERLSARRGESEQTLLVMVRGTHNHQEWFELIKFTTNNEEQLLDWLDILGSNPLPPFTRPKPVIAPSPSTPPRSDAVDVPVGERRLGKSTLASPTNEKSKTPSRYRPVQRTYPPSTPVVQSPVSAASPSPDKTPTQESYSKSTQPARPLPAKPATYVEAPSLPSWESSHHETVKGTKSPPNSTPFREDGAPPPPIHRTLGSTGNIAPPVDLGLPRVKRRGSSPLKHEYHPSDVSSEGSSASSDESEFSQSSSDELDEDDVPDTIPGYSIKRPEPASVESVISESSVSPSHSASQVIVAENIKKPERHGLKFAASVSYWSSKKGIWKDINAEPSSITVHPGSLEVHRLRESHSHQQAYPLQSSGTSEVDNRGKDAGGIVPLVSLVLTPVVMIRRSTALDLEIRSLASPESRLKIDSDMFRFRAASQTEAKNLYEAVHRSRLNNARYIQLSEEARVRSFGQQPAQPGDGSADDDSSSRRRSWFGRKNSYRGSTRAPSVSQQSGSTTISANSFLRRLTGGNNMSFNIEESTLDKQSRPGSVGGGAGGGSLESSSGSSTGGGSASTPPRSLSISLSGSGNSQSRWSNGLAEPFSPDRPLNIRCHLNVQNNRWADKGDCVLHISRPPPGVRQELTLYHGMEKRVIVTHSTKKTGDKPLILLDAVLGSKCFSMLGTKGIMCSVWENLRDEEGNVGLAPAQGGLAGRVTKWCFQCKSVQQAKWIMDRVTSEVPVPGLIGN